MSWHVYRIFRVVALCEFLMALIRFRALTLLPGALFLLHVALVGITAAGMLGSGAGGENSLQILSAKPAHKLSKTSEPYNFPWTSSPYSPSSVCTSPPRAHYSKAYLYLSSVLRYKRFDAVSSRLANLTVFSVIFALSLVGAIGLSARAAFGNGKGLCEDLSSKQPGNCTQAAFALAFAWLSVVIGAPPASLVLHPVGLTIL